MDSFCFVLLYYIPIIKFLIGKGLDVNAVDKNGKTVLNYASSFSDQPDIIHYLKAQGAK